MANKDIDVKSIPGYGMDADPENEPTYPMKNYTGDDHNRINYERAAQQPQNIEVLCSNERPVITAVFGTSTPPSGLSGMIRRYAFKHSEDRYRHWLPLIFADRINVYEGIIADLAKGYMPNTFAEGGIKMELKYNPKKYIAKGLLCAAVAVGVGALLLKKRK
ncbi:hypothetical protein [Mucilaginibacter aquatilis]|uniref:Uncharacterized protein n=1 Tax=Mucilaginibacter aquatilis TaxID=1517760 RepID=A0A6I4IBB6_9SPHI|nr:hypothetical protein [Mucilaginibacter aquatilis]MVN91228.1 hypothetical protein [Mucilaginibacter aquatilis]